MLLQRAVYRGHVRAQTCSITTADPLSGLHTRYDGVIKIAENLWTVLSYNVPELANAGPGTNRMAIFKVPAVGAYETPSLVLVNGVNLCNSTLDGLLALERQEGAKVRFVHDTASCVRLLRRS